MVLYIRDFQCIQCITKYIAANTIVYHGKYVAKIPPFPHTHVELFPKKVETKKIRTTHRCGDVKRKAGALCALSAVAKRKPVA